MVEKTMEKHLANQKKDLLNKIEYYYSLNDFKKVEELEMKLEIIIDIEEGRI